MRLLRGRQNLRETLENTAWLLADKFIQIGLGLVVGVWVARYLGPAHFGELSFALTFVAFFAVLAGAGLDSIVVRDIVRAPETAGETLGTAWAVKVLGGLLGFAFAVGSVFLIRPGAVTLWQMVALIAAGLPFQAFDVIDFWFRAHSQSKRVVWARNSVSVAVGAFRIALIAGRASLIAFAAARLAENVLGVVGLIVVYGRSGATLQGWRVRRARAVSLLTESWPIFVSGLAVLIYSKIDQIMLGTLLTDKTQLGLYSVVVRFSELFDFLPMLFYSSLLPRLIALHAQDEARYRRHLQSYFDLMTGLWLLIALPVSLLAPVIIAGFYGSAYAGAAGVLSVYVWAQFGTNWGVARSCALLIEGRQKISMLLTAAGAVLNIGLNFFLIPRYGAMGATAATLATYFFVVVLMNLLRRDLREFGILILRSFQIRRAILQAGELFR